MNTGGWAFDKHISIGHLLTTFAILISGFWYIADMRTDFESRYIQVKSEISHVKELQDQQNEHVKESLEELKENDKEIKRLLREALKDRE